MKVVRYAWRPEEKEESSRKQKEKQTWKVSCWATLAGVILYLNPNRYIRRPAININRYEGKTLSFHCCSLRTYLAVPETTKPWSCAQAKKSTWRFQFRSTHEYHQPVVCLQWSIGRWFKATVIKIGWKRQLNAARKWHIWNRMWYGQIYRLTGPISAVGASGIPCCATATRSRSGLQKLGGALKTMSFHSWIGERFLRGDPTSSSIDDWYLQSW